jgi:hypothetical protein
MPAVLGIVLGASLAAQQPPQGGQQPATPPNQPAAAAPAVTVPAGVPGTVTCPAPAPPAKLPDRLFVAPVGVLLQPVQSSRVVDFEKFLGYVRDALANATDATTRRQAQGWKTYRMAETGPNNDVLYVFIFDPAVPCVDYAFAPILAAAIPDAAKLDEVWGLYKSSVRGGGTLMNLVPVTLETSGATTGSSTTGKTPPSQQVPLDANPLRPPK